MCFLYKYRSIFTLLIPNYYKIDFLIRISIETQHLFSLKIIVFLVFIRTLTVRKTPKNHSILFFQKSNPCFTKTTGFISYIKVGIQNFLIVENFLIGELSICVHCARVLRVRNFQKVLILFIMHEIQTCIPRPLQNQIPP